MIQMEGESRSGREETREAESSSRGKGISNPSSLPRRNARGKRSRSKSVDNDRRSEAESSSRGRGISNPSSSSRRNVQRSEVESSSRGRSISNPSSLPRRNAGRKRSRSKSVDNDRRSEAESSSRGRGISNPSSSSRRNVHRSEAESSNRGRSISNPSSLLRRNAGRKRSRSKSVDNDRRSEAESSSRGRGISNPSSSSRRNVHRSEAESSSRGRSMDGTINSSNQPSSVDGSIIGSNQHNDDIDVSSRRRRTARMSVPQWDNINPSSNPTTLEVIRSRPRWQELFFSTLELAQLLTMIPDDQPIQPADRDAVQQMPGVVISEEHINNNDDNSTCSICLEKYQVGEEARLMECGHMYHKTCIFEWLEDQHTCPLCRFEMP